MAESVKQQIADALAKRKEVEQQLRDLKHAAIEEIRQTMKDLHITIDEIAEGEPKRGEFKYRDPATGRIWNGYGRQPDWYKEHVAAGRDPRDLLE